MRQGFELMQEKFENFSREFSQLMLSMRNMSQVSSYTIPCSPLVLRRRFALACFSPECYKHSFILNFFYSHFFSKPAKS